MTNSSDPARVDYVRAISEAAAFLASRGEADAPGSWGRWASLPASADIRYPIPALDPARR